MNVFTKEKMHNLCTVCTINEYLLYRKKKGTIRCWTWCSVDPKFACS